jgi:hypothetical protein
MTHTSVLRHPATGELESIQAKLDRRLLPEGTTVFEVEIGQIFNLVIDSKKILSLVPVHLKAPPPSASDEPASNDCGVYLISGRDEVRFIRTIEEDLPIQCWSIKAVRLERIQDDYPLIILTGDLSSATRGWLQPFVFRWNKESERYEMDPVDFR